MNHTGVNLASFAAQLHARGEIPAWGEHTAIPLHPQTLQRFPPEAPHPPSEMTVAEKTKVKVSGNTSLDALRALLHSNGAVAQIPSHESLSLPNGFKPIQNTHQPLNGQHKIFGEPVSRQVSSVSVSSNESPKEDLRSESETDHPGAPRAQNPRLQSWQMKVKSIAPSPNKLPFEMKTSSPPCTDSYAPSEKSTHLPQGNVIAPPSYPSVQTQGMFPSYVAMTSAELQEVHSQLSQPIALMHPYHDDYYRARSRKKAGERPFANLQALPFSSSLQCQYRVPGSCRAPKALVEVDEVELPREEMREELSMRAAIEEAYTVLLRLDDIRFAISNAPVGMSIPSGVTTEIQSLSMQLLNYFGIHGNLESQEVDYDSFGKFLKIPKGVKLVRRAVLTLNADLSMMIVSCLLHSWGTVKHDNTIAKTEEITSLIETCTNVINTAGIGELVQCVKGLSSSLSGTAKLFTVIRDPFAVKLISTVLDQASKQMGTHSSPVSQDGSRRSPPAQCEMWQGVFAQFFNTLLDSFVSLAESLIQQGLETLAQRFFDAVLRNTSSYQRSLLLQELQSSGLDLKLGS